MLIDRTRSGVVDVRSRCVGRTRRSGIGVARGAGCDSPGWPLRPDPLLSPRVLARIAARRGHAIAIVAVARKLAILAWHLLTDDVDYRWAPARLTADKIRAARRDGIGQPYVPGSGYLKAPTATRTGQR